MIIHIYSTSVLIAVTPDLPPRQAWASAVKYVRAMAHVDGLHGLGDGWYRTANRIGYAFGIFRATPKLAD